ncbi:vacuolar membrane-associated protein IML1 [Yarrowia lipolytica]|nr:vacuolar membrane-associated protein IML1 [Yarrowia lipolytica]
MTTWVSLQAWTHDQKTCAEEVIVDVTSIPGASEGDIAELKSGDKSHKLLFQVTPIPQEVLDRIPTCQLSIKSGNLLSSLGVAARSQVQIKLRKKEQVEADLVEICFKETYLTRADMWQITTMLRESCVYHQKRIVFCDVIRCWVDSIFKNGRKVFSAYIGPNTNIVFRSESSRMIIIIQLSQETWHFEETGEIIFHRMVNSLLPDIFKQWEENEHHHTVTIVLFTSVSMDSHAVKLKRGEKAKDVQDFYRVVCDQVQLSQWEQIMVRLRFEFQNFAKEVLTESHAKSHTEIRGRILPSVKSNILGAITLAASLVHSPAIDRDLRRTNVEVIVVSPGSGVYEVEYDALYRASEKISSTEVGVDIICMSKAPLHVTPLFLYKPKKCSNQLEYCVPSWIDISYYGDSDFFTNQWVPRCKIYEIQMMGVMENELSAITIDYLNKPSGKKPLSEYCREYDASLFGPIAVELSVEDAASVVSKMRSDTFPKLPVKQLLSSKGSISSLHAPTAVTSKTPPPKASVKVADVRPSPAASKPRVSALTSLLAFGVRAEKSAPASPALSAVNTLSSIQSMDLRRDNDSVKRDTESIVTDDTVHNTNAEPRITEIAPIAPSLPFAPNLKPKKSTSTLSQSPTYNRIAATPDQEVERRSSLSQKVQMGLSGSPLDHRGKVAKAASANAKSINTETTPEKRNMMWRNIRTPSNISQDEMLDILTYSRWRTVYPQKTKRRSAKWKLLASPAALPLRTNIFPTVAELQTEYRFQVYDVSLDTDMENVLGIHGLFREMVSVRLCKGFQLAIGSRVRHVESQRSDGRPSAITTDIGKDALGAVVYLTTGDQVHRISCDYSGMMNVQIYHAIDKVDIEEPVFDIYARRTYSDKFKHFIFPPFDTSSKRLNWNLYDHTLAGYDTAGSAATQTRLNQLRVVLIPSFLSRSKNLGHDDSSEVYNAEEVRLDGLRRILGGIYRHSISRDEDKERAKIAPNLKFYTGELEDFLFQIVESNPAELAGGRDSLFMKRNQRFDKNIKLAQLATELQAPKGGIRFFDRRWHWKSYPHCFIGQDFVEWLIDNYSDIDTPDEAVAYGNELMKKDFFVHVEDRHAFLDGHYFYQLKSEYATEATDSKPAEEKSGWFNSKRSMASVSSEKSLGRFKGSRNQSVQSFGDFLSLSRVTSRSSNDQKEEEINPITVEISKSVRVDLDPSKKSYRPETVLIHHDRIHNPRKCFHLRFEWANTTPKFIEDYISGLTRTCERYGLKLVELPILEVSALLEHNPFASEITLDMPTLDQLSGLPPHVLEYYASDPHAIAREILHHFGFVIDTLSMSDWKLAEVQIRNSWGVPTYKYSQWVEKNGLLIAQVVGDQIIMIPNNLQLNRQSGAQSNAIQLQSEAQGIILEMQYLMCRSEKVRDMLGKVNLSPEASPGTMTPGEEGSKNGTPKLAIEAKMEGRVESPRVEWREDVEIAPEVEHKGGADGDENDEEGDEKSEEGDKGESENENAGKGMEQDGENENENENSKDNKANETTSEVKEVPAGVEIEHKEHVEEDKSDGPEPKKEDKGKEVEDDK